jgi:hypothetical protein
MTDLLPNQINKQKIHPNKQKKHQKTYRGIPLKQPLKQGPFTFLVEGKINLPYLKLISAAVYSDDCVTDCMTLIFDYYTTQLLFIVMNTPHIQYT